jgi:hypothetical protein
MRIFTKAAVAAIAIAFILPTAAFAHGNKDDNSDRGGLRAGLHLGWHKNKKQSHALSGTVTAVSTNSFDVKKADNTTVKVLVGSSTKIYRPFGSAIAITDIKVNDKVQVKGMADSSVANQLTASFVLVMPQNTHPAKAKGTVTAVSGSTVTVQTNNHGVISNVTVNTDANTTVKKSDGSAGVFADIAVGSKVAVKGLWQELANTLTALKVRLKA